MQKSLIAMLITGVMFFADNVAWGLSAAPWQTEELVEKSELIVVGKIIETGKGAATVEVSEILKGEAVKVVKITGIRKWRGQPETLPQDKEYLLFLSKVDGEYQIVGSNRHLEGLREPAVKEEAKKVIQGKLKRR
ncbi:MAG: hypothetical protein FJ222_12560 [Lentisphaerae bacterium]|nr:hypothetical protein [Lentisphaerota bacterium]